MGNDGAVWGLGNPQYANGDRPVYKWNGTTWTTPGGGLKQLSVGNARVVHAPNAATAPVDTCGNVMIGGSGSIELKFVTIDLDGTLSVDLDLDNDGKMVWAEAGERNDFAVASSLGMTVSLTKFPLLPKVPVNASVYDQGVVSKATDVDCDPGCSTPLGSATGVKVGDLSQGRIRVTAEAGGSPLVDFMPGLATGGWRRCRGAGCGCARWMTPAAGDPGADGARLGRDDPARHPRERGTEARCYRGRVRACSHVAAETSNPRKS